MVMGGWVAALRVHRGLHTAANAKRDGTGGDTLIIALPPQQKRYAPVHPGDSSFVARFRHSNAVEFQERAPH
jgi:hypothetical protein